MIEEVEIFNTKELFIGLCPGLFQLFFIELLALAYHMQRTGFRVKYFYIQLT
jgi:hypothetical protein